MDIEALEKQCTRGNPDKNSTMSSNIGSWSSLISYSTLKTEGHIHNEDSRSEENEEGHIFLEKESSCSYEYFSQDEFGTNTFENSPKMNLVGKKLV